MKARTQGRRKARLRMAIDVGGTFTDGIAEQVPSGRIWVAKCLTTPDDPGEAVAEVAAELLRQVAATLAIDDAAALVDEGVHGTTLVTNTIIERRGARVALILTEGTKDVLDIGRESRYDLYDLELKQPTPLVPPRLRHELVERLDGAGRILTPLSTSSLDAVLDRIKGQRVDAVAVCFLHAYVNDVHEKSVADAIRRRLPGIGVSLSSDIAREIREYERMSTTTANAYVQPLMASYLGRLEGRFADLGVKAPLRIMVSSGGFTSSEAAAKAPILLLESGPAGGVLSAINTAAEAGVADVLSFDMGGTTAKACVAVDGEASTTYSFETGRVHRFKRGSGLPILTPSIDLIEIGAGGGSIAYVSALGLLNVGPGSAGAQPGPACYDQGGESATVTDADLVLGYLDTDTFLGGEMTLSRERAETALGELGARLGLGLAETAWGIADIVNENMAGAARVHIAEKGFDPRRFTLVATGGAGPVHAVEVAQKLLIKRVICTIAAGAGSCLGLLAAPARVDRSWSRVELLAEVDWTDVKKRARALHKDAERELGSAGARGERIDWLLGAEVRYAGQGNTVVVWLPYRDVGPRLAKPFRKAFETRYAQLYGQLVPGALPEMVTWRIMGRSRQRTHPFRFAETGKPRAGRPKPVARRPIYLPLRAAYGTVPVYERYALPAGTRLKGPLILQERESTVVVARPARVEVLPNLTVSIELP